MPSEECTSTPAPSPTVGTPSPPLSEPLTDAVADVTAPPLIPIADAIPDPTASTPAPSPEPSPEPEPSMVPLVDAVPSVYPQVPVYDMATVPSTVSPGALESMPASVQQAMRDVDGIVIDDAVDSTPKGSVRASPRRSGLAAAAEAASPMTIGLGMTACAAVIYAMRRQRRAVDPSREMAMMMSTHDDASAPMIQEDA